MRTEQLLKERMKEKGLTRFKVIEMVGGCEKTLRNYLNGTTTNGKYLLQILEILNISVEEWNSCTNIILEEEI